jgi:hypothetical protein
MDHEDRASLAEAVTARGDDEDLVREPPAGDLLFEGLLDGERAAGNAPGPGADEEMGAIVRHGYSGDPFTEVRILSALAWVIWP